MTKISFISGMPQGAYLNEAADRGQQVDTRLPDFGLLSNGQAKGALLLRQTKIFAEYYPERPEIRKAYELVRNHLSGKANHNVGTSDIERQVAKQLKTIPAKRPSVGSIDSARAEYMAAILEGGQLPNPVDVCRGYFDIFRNTSELQECAMELGLMLNASEKINACGHHMLYEFAAAGAPESAVVTKRILHRSAVAAIGRVTKLSRDNMSGWIRSSILAGNVRANVGPIQPEESVTELRNGFRNQDGIGAVPIAVAIIGAVTAALTAAAGLVSAFQGRGNLLANNAQGFGDPSFGPERSDFLYGGAGGNGGPGGGPGSSNSMLIPLLVAGGGFLMLNSK